MRLGKKQIALMKSATKKLLDFENFARLKNLHQKGLMMETTDMFGYPAYQLTPAGMRALADALEKEADAMEKEKSK